MERRNTIQRQLVLDTVTQLDHPDAEQVYAQIVQTHPHVSKATVYRNLNLLSDQQQIKKICTGGGPDKFDFNTTEHYHMRCRICGKLTDAFMPLNNLKAAFPHTENFQIEKINLEFVGICSECKNKNK